MKEFILGKLTSNSYIIHPIFQLLPALEERQIFTFDPLLLSGLWINAGISCMHLHEKGTQSLNLYSVTFGQSQGHGIEERGELRVL